MERLETTVQRYNWAARSIIGAHCAGSRIMTILFLFMLIFANNVQFARAADTKTKTQLTPTIKFGGESNYSVDVTVGELNFQRPTLTITDNDKSISRYFSLTWSFENGKDSTDASGRVYSVDKTTGSVISKLYDGVTIGRRTGTATVVLTLSIAPRYKDTYELATGASTTASYTINVKSPEVTAEYRNGSTLLNGEQPKGLQFYCLNGTTTTCNYPTPKLSYTLDKSVYDVTADYDYKYEVTDGYQVTDWNKTISTTLTSDKGGSGTLTITATPKKEYESMLGTSAITTEISLETAYRTEKLKTYISFSKDFVDALKYRNVNQGTFTQSGSQQQTYTPDVIVTDENGNDISNLINSINWTATPEDVFYNYSNDPHDKVNETTAWYGALKEKNTLPPPNIYTQSSGTRHYGLIQHSRPDDYLIEASVTLSNTTLYDTPVAKVDKDGTTTVKTVKGQFYGTGVDTRTNEKKCLYHQIQPVHLP